MSRYKIILNEFGLGRLKPYILSGAPLQTDGGDYPEQTPLIVEEKCHSQFFGTPVFSPVYLISHDGDLSIQLETVLVEVTQRKNIVRTEIAGRNGTVKEYVSDGDYYVVMRGGIFSESPVSFPHDQVKKLLQLLQLKETIVVASDFLQMFGTFDLAITNYKMIQKKGQQSSQLFEIRAFSDIPIELLIDENA